MKKNIYIKPETEVASVLMMENDILRASRWNVHDENGTNGTPGDSDDPLEIVKDENPDEIFGKDNRNMWDGWDD